MSGTVSNVETTQTVAYVEAAQSVADSTEQHTAKTNLSDITDTKLIVGGDETFSIDSTESIVRTKAIIDGELTVNGALELTQ